MNDRASIEPADSPWISAEQAAAMLGVKRASLYSYVSRGQLRAERLAGQQGSHFMLADVSRLVRQRASVRSPAKLAQTTLDWGEAVLPSSITLVKDGRLYYRGQDAVELAEHATLEEVAALLWQVQPPITDQPIKTTTARVRRSAKLAPAAPATLPSMPQAMASWFAMRTDDATAQLDPFSAQMHWVHAMCAALVGQKPRAQDTPRAIHHQLQTLWRLDDRAGDLLRRALVLCADHELNSSTFAVRVVASTAASLQASLGAGLAALSGPRHGGMTALIDAHWEQWHARADALEPLAPSLLALLRNTQVGQGPGYCTGFGHRLYPDGDPRSLALIEALAPSDEVRALTRKVHTQTGLHPSLDYALAAIERGLQLPRGASFVLFALGRSVGWIAHANEQMADGQLIRPRASYTGAELPPSLLEAPSQPAIKTRVVRFR